jgi:hypothetical protein
LDKVKKKEEGGGSNSMPRALVAKIRIKNIEKKHTNVIIGNKIEKKPTKMSLNFVGNILVSISYAKFWYHNNEKKHIIAKYFFI